MAFPVRLEDWMVELQAFCLGWGDEYGADRGGLGKYEHLRRAFHHLYPDLQWNEWLERMMRGFCDRRYATVMGDTVVRVVSLVGVAGAGKTFAAGRFAFLWWLARPAESIAILTSTTKTAIGQRVWPIIQASWSEARARLARDVYHTTEDRIDLGNMVASQKVLQAAPGNNARAIFAQAVKDGETVKAEAFIRGQHAPRILVMVDEANETPEAIFSAIANLRKGCQDLTIIVIGNPISRLDPHGRCCQPRGGWGSRLPGAVEWPTAGVPEWQIDSGLCLQFRGTDSPNVRAGRTTHRHIYTWEDWQASQVEGVRNTLHYWRYDAGEWAPDGVCRTVFNETACLGWGVRDGVVFAGGVPPVAISFLDPGFGGDACVQVVGRLGEVVVGGAGGGGGGGGGGTFPTPTSSTTRQTILVDHLLELVLDPDARAPDGRVEDYEHQIARQVIANCGAHGVEPRNMGLYSTGTGRGVASILYTDWSNEVLRVEEGGSPSDLPASATDSRPAKEVYDRRVTELWFSARNFAESGQLRGLGTATVIELCAREYETTGKPWRYRIEEKDKVRAKLGHSCDKADATVGLVELVRVRHGERGGGVVADRAGQAWERWASASQAVEADPGYSATNDQEELAHAGSSTGSMDGAGAVW